MGGIPPLHICVWDHQVLSILEKRDIGKKKKLEATTIYEHGDLLQASSKDGGSLSRSVGMASPHVPPAQAMQMSRAKAAMQTPLGAGVAVVAPALATMTALAPSGRSGSTEKVVTTFPSLWQRA